MQSTSGDWLTGPNYPETRWRTLTSGHLSRWDTRLMAGIHSSPSLPPSGSTTYIYALLCCSTTSLNRERSFSRIYAVQSRRTRVVGFHSAIFIHYYTVLMYVLVSIHVFTPQKQANIQCSCSGWPTGNGKNLSNSQACCLAQLCLAAA